MLLEVSDCQLVLVDYQERLMRAIPDAEDVLAHARQLAQAARMLDVPVWGTEQNPDKLGTNDGVLRDASRKTLRKMSFSAVADGLLECLRPPEKGQSGNARSLPRHLQRAAQAAPPVRETVVLGGCEAHVCLLQTALELMEQEMDVWVVTDACGSRALRNRDAAFDRLAAAGCELVTTEMVLFEWLRSASHPRFREVQALIK